MPHSQKPSAQNASAPWAETFRQLVRASYGPGWILREHRGGRTQITRAWLDGSRSSVTVVLPWRAESASALLVLVERLDSVLQHQSMSLARAMACINLEDSPPSAMELRHGATNWHWAVEQFRFHMVEESGRVKPLTWHRTYRSHLEQTLAVLERPRAPRDGRGVLKALVMAHPTPPGGSGRRERLGNAARFLAFAVDGCVPWSGVKPEACDLIGDQ